MKWTKEAVIDKLTEISSKGFICVPDGMFRKDDGIVGQILEREFGVAENNLHLADLGIFELKALRYKKKKPNMLTLFHQTSSSGLTPTQIFDRFGYIRASRRNGQLKKKLFTTIRGNSANRLGFLLKATSESEIHLYKDEEYLATWDLSSSMQKIEQVILVFAETRGAVNSKEEEFHYTQAFLLSHPKSLSEAIAAGAVVMDLCIDQPADGSASVHDRGPHIRIPTKKLSYLFDHIEKLL